MELLNELKAEATFTPTESQVFRDLKSSGAYALAVNAISRMLLTCGDMALDDGRAEYWSGVRDGLDLFFQMTESEAARASDLIAEIQAREPVDEEDEDDDVDITQAISALGSSPL
jgi:hypothetical protein